MRLLEAKLQMLAAYEAMVNKGTWVSWPDGNQYFVIKPEDFRALIEPSERVDEADEREEGPHPGERGDVERCDSRFRAAGDNHVGLPRSKHFAAQADRRRTRRAGCNRGQARPPRTKLDRYLSCGHVQEAHRQ